MKDLILLTYSPASLTAACVLFVTILGLMSVFMLDSKPKMSDTINFGLVLLALGLVLVAILFPEWEVMPEGHALGIAGFIFGNVIGIYFVTRTVRKRQFKDENVYREMARELLRKNILLTGMEVIDIFHLEIPKAPTSKRNNLEYTLDKIKISGEKNIIFYWENFRDNYRIEENIDDLDEKTILALQDWMDEYHEFLKPKEI